MARLPAEPPRPTEGLLARVSRIQNTQCKVPSEECKVKSDKKAVSDTLHFAFFTRHFALALKSPQCSQPNKGCRGGPLAGASC
ncbi:hypothetical protein LBMAG52_44110 [Planctomycetia bacterium]|nr:hypothetical protein LBMAG52_44110 [Planctomycetia bacterium]